MDLFHFTWPHDMCVWLGFGLHAECFFLAAKFRSTYARVACAPDNARVQAPPTQHVLRVHHSTEASIVASRCSISQRFTVCRVIFA